MSDFKNYLFEKFIKNHKRLKKLISLTGYCKQDDMYWGSSDNYEQYVSYEVWKYQQARVDELKAQLNNMEACYIEVNKERDELQKTNISLEAGLRKNSKNKQKLLGKNIELQKRIDEALEDLEYPTAPWDETIASVVKALRGASD